MNVSRSSASAHHCLTTVAYIRITPIEDTHSSCLYVMLKYLLRP